MNPRNLICIVIDGLHAGMLGAYGNSWVRTPQFDRLAAESLVFDQALVDSPQLGALYRGLWLAKGAADRSSAAATAEFPRALQAAGWHTALITDEPAVVELARDEFAERPMVDTGGAPQLSALFSSAIDWLNAPPPKFCLWLHARGLYGSWDAPYAYRERYADEDDPRPPDFVETPDRWLSEDADPDELLGIAHAYAGQIALLDECVGELLDQMQATSLAENSALVLLSARGFPLGEHRRVGKCDLALYNELTQIPWMLRFPDGLGRLARSQALVKPADLPGTLLDWLALNRTASGFGAAGSLLPIASGEVESWHPCLYLTSERESALRTPAWCLRQPETGAAELYSKPSDRWEVNEVAKLCPEIVASLQTTLAAINQQGPPAIPAELPEELVREVD